MTALPRAAAHRLGIARDPHGVVHGYVNIPPDPAALSLQRLVFKGVEVDEADPSFVHVSAEAQGATLPSSYVTLCMQWFGDDPSWVDVDDEVTCIQCMYATVLV